jgi:hypothetical protein
MSKEAQRRPLTPEERKEQSEAFHRGLFEQIFGAPPEDVIPGLRQTILNEVARRKRLAEEYPEEWIPATTTEAEIARKRREWERGHRGSHLDRGRGARRAGDVEDEVVAEEDEVSPAEEDHPLAEEGDELQVRLDEVLAGLPEVLADSGDIRITRADVDRWIRQAWEEVGEELAALLLAKDWPGEGVLDDVEEDDK